MKQTNQHGRDQYLRQPTAAAFLAVSVRYLRASTCPKTHLESLQPDGRPLTRYKVADLIDWADGSVHTTEGIAKD